MGGLVGNGGINAGVTNAAGRDIAIVIRDFSFGPGGYTVDIPGRGDAQTQASIGLGEDHVFKFCAPFGEQGWPGTGDIRFTIDYNSRGITTWMPPFRIPTYGVLVYVKY